MLSLETSWLLSQESKYIPNYPLTIEFGDYTGFRVDDDDMGVEVDCRCPNLRSRLGGACDFLTANPGEIFSCLFDSRSLSRNSSHAIHSIPHDAIGITHSRSY